MDNLSGDFPAQEEIETEPMIGWRLWRVVKRITKLSSDGTEYFLVGLDANVVWEPRTFLAAECNNLDWRYPKPHPVPSENHGCGFWALNDKEPLLELLNKRKLLQLRDPKGNGVEHAPDPSFNQVYSYLTGPPYVLGKVSLWGEVIVGEKGMRSQYAYPYDDLVLINGDSSMANDLSYGYQLPFRLGEI